MELYTVQTRRPLAYTVRDDVISAHSPARVHAALPLRFGWGVVGLGIRDGRKDLGGFVAWSVAI